jgi:hypothetical protein
MCEAARSTTRKVWLAGGLRSGGFGSAGAEMALEALEKAPLTAIFQQVFDHFLRVFRRHCPRARKLARIQPQK